MKKLILFLFLMSSLSFLQAQKSLNVEMLGTWDDDSLPEHFFGTFNDIWGYAAEGREYAFMGSSIAIHVLDVTDPTNIVEIDRIQPGVNTSWRDFKVYQDRAYFVSDNSGEGMVIVDLSDLPNSVSVVKQTSEFFSSSHNIFIDVPNGKLYAVAADVSAHIQIIDLAPDPDNPTLIAAHNLEGGQIHDVYVRDNIAYASSEYDGFFIYDFNDPMIPITLATKQTNGYNHSNWVSDDGTFAIFAEEVPTGLPLGIMDLTNMMDNDIEVTTFFQRMLVEVAEGETKNTPHNPYILGDLGITSYYEDGIHIYDLSNPAEPNLVGYYDTYPENDIENDSTVASYNGYAGCWGMYPYLPSGNLLASDMDHGLFVLKYTPGDINVNNDELPASIPMEVFPNPTSDVINIKIESQKATDFDYQLITLSGQLIKSGTFTVNGKYQESITIDDIPVGMYMMVLNNGEKVLTNKISIIR